MRESERIQVAVEPHLNSGVLPGFSAVVSQHGSVRSHVFGSMSLTSGVPMLRDSIFRISSMSKPITAAAALILADRGVISLDEPIHRFVPELSDRKVLRNLNSPLADTVPAARAVLVRDLLNYTDGFGQLYGSPTDYPILAAALDLGLRMGPPEPGAQSATEEWLARLGTLPLMRQPGHSWLYDTAADVLSVLIARAAGTDVATFLHENLFEPLGMRDTSFSVPTEKLHRLVSAYTPDAATGLLAFTDDPITGQWSTAPAFSSGAGGLVSTCDDYLAFATMLLNQGRAHTELILSPASVKLMTTDSLTERQKSRSAAIPLDFRTHSWGSGLSVVTAEDQIWQRGTYGWTGGLGTFWVTNPHEQLVAIAMTQVAMTSPDSGQLFDDFSRAVLAGV